MRKKPEQSKQKKQIAWHFSESRKHDFLSGNKVKSYFLTHFSHGTNIEYLTTK